MSGLGTSVSAVKAETDKIALVTAVPGAVANSIENLIAQLTTTTLNIAAANPGVGITANSYLDRLDTILTALINVIGAAAAGGAPVANSFLDRIYQLLITGINKIGLLDSGSAIVANSFLDRLNAQLTTIINPIGAIAGGNFVANSYFDQIKAVILPLGAQNSGGAPDANSYLGRVQTNLNNLISRIGAADPGVPITTNSYLDRLTNATAQNSNRVTVAFGNGVKGAWVQMLAATSGISSAIITTGAVVAANSSYLDIGTGGAGAEVVLIGDLVAAGGAAAAGNFNNSIPIRIPAGTRIAFRGENNGAAPNVQFALTVLYR